MSEKIRIIRSIIILVFVFFVIGYLIYTRIIGYSLAPTLKQIDLTGLPVWEIPILYLADYFSHGWICLLFAFVVAGLIYEFIPKDKVTKYMGAGRKTGYLLAIGASPFIAVCSCTMIPLFTGVLYSGAGLGPAVTFLLMAPAANILSILLTGELVSWNLAVARLLASIIVSLMAGMIISKTSWGRSIEKEMAEINKPSSMKLDLVTPPLDERLLNALKFAGYIAKKIMPFFILGLIAVSFIVAYLPEDIVVTYLTGIGGVLIASVLGGPLYTPTLVEIVLARGFLTLGMSQGALLAWLMGQPYDVANALAVSRIIRWKVVLTYMFIAWAGSVIFGILYGVLIGSL